MYSLKLEKMSALNLKKTAIAASFALSVGVALAGTTTGNNFTMLDASGFVLTNGANDVVFTWDGTLNTSVSGATSNATLSSVTPFFGVTWTAYNTKIYGPGTYTISTADGGGSGCPFGLIICATGGNYSVTVGASELMAHIKFAWSVTEGIDVVQVWKLNNSWSGTALSTRDNLYTGAPNPNGNSDATVWSFVSTDSDGDLYHGSKMIDGPFQGFSANFNVMLNKNPSAFSFTDLTNVVLGATSESGAITVTGTDATQTEVYVISVTGGEYSIAGGTYTSTTGTVIEGQTVKVRHTSSSSSCGVVDTDLSIGGTRDTFSTTATGSGCTDTKVNNFTFTDQTGAALGATVESNSITVSGIDSLPVTVAISITGGDYSVNGGAYSSTASTVSLNDTVKVRHTSSSAYETAVNTVLTIGSGSNSVSDTFTSTTKASTTVSVQADEPGKMPTGGCSISTSPAQVENRADWWLVAGFIAWLGMIVRRRRQTQI